MRSRSVGRGRGALRSLASIALGLAGAAGSTGCYSDSCADAYLCEVPPPEPSPCDGHPATALALDMCGVFVSAQGDDNSPGTKDAPVRTLQHAVGLAAHGRGDGQGPTRRVYACGGLFEEEIALPSGVDLWGGRLCDDGDDWSYMTGRSADRITRRPSLRQRGSRCGSSGETMRSSPGTT
ncbi:hypothetical protein [Sorangium sp. So ce1099]|uniref:hypothetical protein n=1 Tax=Sorangium sp. So ce1099 TaxID=3133331 RepID=UPI003F5E420D